MKRPEKPAPSQGNQLGTFGGVFTPSVLTILGVIMFLRAGFVVGEAGILGAVAILVIAKAITIMTSLSVSAISTNTEIRGGGAYFMISRVLGAEFGGAIGLALFVAQALSVPFYILGFTEAVVRSYPILEPKFQTIALTSAGLLFLVAYVGANWAIRTQYVIMVVLFGAVVVTLGGLALHFDGQTFAANWAPAYTAVDPQRAAGGTFSFWLIFAIFFPAVTGILAGVNMSGDLKEPARSIPLGTFLAIGVSAAVYLLILVLCGGAFARDDLIHTPYLVLQNHALFGMGGMVSAGVFAASLSSALGSYLGAPRILQAVARDEILRPLRPFSQGAPETDEPRRALEFTGVITIAVLLWAGNDSGGGPLNAVAGLITMFFLYTYGMTNLAAFIEAFGQNPSFRPRFRYFHWVFALLGGAGCVGVALLIDPFAAVISLLIILGLLWYLKTRELEASFGDARRGFVYTQVRKNLLRLRDMPEDHKNWRPTILVLSGNPASRETLVSYAVWLEAGRGIVLMANVLKGTLEQGGKRRAQAEKQLADFCAANGIEAFPVVAVGPDVHSNLSLLLQTTSLGSIRPNLAMFGWVKTEDAFFNMADLLRVAANSNMSQVILCDRGVPPAPELGRRRGAGAKRRIDVWWRGHANGELMLLLAHLITRNWEWMGSEIRVLRVVDNDQGREPAAAALQGLIDSARVDATAVALVRDSRTFTELLQTSSADASCVILGFELPAPGAEASFHTGFSAMLEGLPTVLLINSQAHQGILV
ncbi:MAG: amino acid permease [Planctomycetes bacterium]|nr:amino acid permease [Planctomycetota bacterium]